MDWSHFISIANIVVSMLIAIVLFRVQTKAAKIDRLEEKLDQKAEQIINARFAAIEGRVHEPIKRFSDAVDRIEKRLDRGDEEFGAQAEKTHSLDKKILEAKSEVRDWARGLFATVEELRELKNSVRDLERAMRSSDGK